MGAFHRSTDNTAFGSVESKNGLSYSARVANDWKISSSTFDNMNFTGADLVVHEDVEVTVLYTFSILLLLDVFKSQVLHCFP